MQAQITQVNDGAGNIEAAQVAGSLFLTTQDLRATIGFDINGGTAYVNANVIACTTAVEIDATGQIYCTASDISGVQTIAAGGGGVFQIAGRRVSRTVSITDADSPFSANDDDGIDQVYCDTSGGPITVNLPAAGGDNVNREINVKNTDTGVNDVTVQVTGGGNIDSAATFTLSAEDAISCRSSGGQWWIV